MKMKKKFTGGGETRKFKLLNPFSPEPNTITTTTTDHKLSDCKNLIHPREYSIISHSFVVKYLDSLLSRFDASS